MTPPPDIKQPRILVVEDEKSIREGLADVLRYRGYYVDSVEDGLSALRAIEHDDFELMLLDIMLPELDGYRVCERLRAQGKDLSILMLTAKGSEEDILRGFEAGADDYVTKPFSLKELLARVQAMLRRNQSRVPSSFAAGPLTIDVERSLARASDTEVSLSAREVAILRLLVEDPGRIVSRRTMLRQIWGMHHVEQIETRTVDVHIAKLRKKLGSVGTNSLETVRGQGYRWQS